MYCYWLPQLWSHIDNVSTTVLTPTILQNLSTVSSKTIILPFVMTSQSFLLPRLSSSVSSPTKKVNIVLTARQTTAYQQPRNALPHFLKNRPSSVTSACLLNIEKGKAIESSSIEEEDA